MELNEEQRAQQETAAATTAAEKRMRESTIARAEEIGKELYGKDYSFADHAVGQ